MASSRKTLLPPTIPPHQHQTKRCARTAPRNSTERSHRTSRTRLTFNAFQLSKNRSRRLRLGVRSIRYFARFISTRQRQRLRHSASALGDLVQCAPPRYENAPPSQIAPPPAVPIPQPSPPRLAIMRHVDRASALHEASTEAPTAYAFTVKFATFRPLIKTSSEVCLPIDVFDPDHLDGKLFRACSRQCTVVWLQKCECLASAMSSHSQLISGVTVST